MNDSKRNSKVECTLENNQEMLRRPRVTGTQKEWNSFTEKMSEKEMGKNAWQSAQRNCENGSTNDSKQSIKVECAL